MKSNFFEDAFEPEISFNLQEKNPHSVPDATIKQDSFKIVVETKLSDWFHKNQLENHLSSFSNESYKVFITLAPVLMNDKLLAEFNSDLQKYNKDKLINNKTSPIIHKNTTFEAIANAIGEVIDDRDYEMQEVLSDYLEYCYNDNLINGADAGHIMRMQLAGTTLSFNLENNVYYDKEERGFRPHNYIGLYNKKSVRAVGKICAKIIAVEKYGELVFTSEEGDITEERKATIIKAIEDGDNYGYDLRTIPHRYFFVEKFYETDFKKTSRGGCMGSRIFNLLEFIGCPQVPESTEKLAQLLKEKSWD